MINFKRSYDIKKVEQETVLPSKEEQNIFKPTDPVDEYITVKEEEKPKTKKRRTKKNV